MSGRLKPKTARVTLEMDPNDLDRFLAAFNDGKLAGFGVVAIDVPSQPDHSVRSKTAAYLGKGKAKDGGPDGRRR